ncbi:MAG: undecaprenyldiphospho-muramoylpentapeptide beta-N-acetylglucosaminyltransferase [Candidatus Hydrogenedentota bacterium]
MRIMITGGGTGGHTSPAIAVIEELQKRDPLLAVQWVGRNQGLERRICERNGIAYRGVPIEGWPRSRSLRRVWVAVKLAYSAVRCWLYIRTFRPQLVFGVGGYVSLPCGLAAQRREVPTVIHEQNRLLGMANRMLAPKAARILLSFEDTLGEYPRERAVVIGNPVRAGFLHPPSREDACAALGLDPSIPVVLVCGGSQGAQSLNEALTAVFPHFSSGEVQFLWMAGQSGIAEARRVSAEHTLRIDTFAFIDDMVTACAAANLIVSRSGASTTAELACLGKPSILVPFPHATDNHQEQNARAFEEAGAATMILDSELTGDRLAETIKDLIEDSGRLADMGDAARSLARPGAAETIAEEILGLIFQRPQEESEE